MNLEQLRALEEAEEKVARLRHALADQVGERMTESERVERMEALLRAIRDDSRSLFYPTGLPTLRLTTAINELVGPGGALEPLAAVVGSIRESSLRDECREQREAKEAAYQMIYALRHALADLIDECDNVLGHDKKLGWVFQPDCKYAEGFAEAVERAWKALG